MKREVTVGSKKILVRALIGSFLPLLHSDANSRALSAPMQSKTSESRRIVVALIFRNSLRVLIISRAGPTQFGSIFFSFRFFDVKNRSPPLLCPDVRHSTNEWKYKYNLIGSHGNEWMLVGYIQKVVFHLISHSFFYLCLIWLWKWISYVNDFVCFFCLEKKLPLMISSVLDESQLGMTSSGKLKVAPTFQCWWFLDPIHYACQKVSEEK